MHPDTLKICFCFPDSIVKNRRTFIDALIRNIQLDKNIGYAGYSHKKYLHEDLTHRFDVNDIQKYQPLSIENQKEIERVIRLTIRRCSKKLSSTTIPIVIFIFPWFPGKKEKEFGGVNGFTPYKNTFNLFISPSEFSTQSLRETVAHELNHAILFNYFPSKQTLLDSIISEGLAENFREEVMKGMRAPWSRALTAKETQKIFTELKPLLNRYDLYEEVFWNGSKYRKWAGYSIGYNIVKSFRKKNSKLTWKEIMKMKSQEIFNMSQFIKK
ncbi:MAG: DUF2268 domain-containing putative Zn-dependent protease [bacterium]|nr:DUF2268 domain-containing putative Zn-dependent protease [bacterium]